LCYSSSSILIDGKYGKAIALAYAANVSGYQAALDLVEIFRDTKGTDSSITLCGVIPVSAMEYFPQCNVRQNRVGKKKALDPVTNFAKTTILANHRHCRENYKAIGLKGLTKVIFNSKSRTNSIVNCKHLDVIVHDKSHGTGQFNVLGRVGWWHMSYVEIAMGRGLVKWSAMLSAVSILVRTMRSRSTHSCRE
jgi:hypothetical protein